MSKYRWESDGQLRGNKDAEGTTCTVKSEMSLASGASSQHADVLRQTAGKQTGITADLKSSTHSVFQCSFIATFNVEEMFDSLAPV